ncbi:MAG: tRNA (adenosine(37)-N6)-threonylcarbamoyltransferase complex ATPase subunit type 1 TsaE [Myxococcales bacterium]|nr:tRNA (adenosine(37)-N6)-threonylcarbamoyltransferase complex ATPase subunit type 1 TsaE [Myxococcales bacterium]
MQRIFPSPEATRAAACALARAAAPGGLVVALIGPLGAGKTVFAKGLAEGLGIDPGLVASPTFVIASEYSAPDGRRLTHVDLYRIESAAELEAAGFLDWLEPGVLVAVEWADRFPEAMPADRLEVRLSRPDAAEDPARRTLHAMALGATAEAALAGWSARLAAAAG